MHERELEQVMSDFYHSAHRAGGLTIIETGIDVPSANTILIERADKFGLAQLHQLRGRVGRSHHQAYAYLLTPPRRQMTPDAEKRLKLSPTPRTWAPALSSATHDLGDPRRRRVARRRPERADPGGRLHPLHGNARRWAIPGRAAELEQPLGGGLEVNLRVPALIPEDYLPDVHAR